MPRSRRKSRRLSSICGWRVCVNSKIRHVVPPVPEAGKVASMFGLGGTGAGRALGTEETLYDRFELEISPGQIVAVVGPSGAGKTILLREVAASVPGSIWLDADKLARCEEPAVALLGGTLAERMEILSRCGLAEAPAMIAPAGSLSGGQLHRLALAMALSEARRRPDSVLLIADEFAAVLDTTTASLLCRQIRKIVRSDTSWPRPPALLLATPHSELLAELEPDRVIVKPLREDPYVLTPPQTKRRRRKAGTGSVSWRCLQAKPLCWRIVRSCLADYHKLGRFHYLAGPPAAHKRIYVVRVPSRQRRLGEPDTAAVLVISPPLRGCRGRNAALPGRYTVGDRLDGLQRLNEEIEAVSRVIVHPMYRGCGLAVRLIRHALATAETPFVEALAAMGAIHPFFEKAGMKAYPVGPDVHSARLLSAAEAVGLSDDDVVAVGPVKKLLARRRSAKGGFLRAELDRCIRRTLSAKRLARMDDPISHVCRQTARQYVYYLARGMKESRQCRKKRGRNPE